jgi:hypothetical protein
MSRNDQRPATTDFRRPLLGILAIIFALGAIGCWIWPPSAGVGLEWQAACWRFAPILAVLWLAYDELQRIPKWLWIALPIAIIIIVKWPTKTLLLGVPLVIVLALLKMRWKIR